MVASAVPFQVARLLTQARARDKRTTWLRERLAAVESGSSSAMEVVNFSGGLVWGALLGIPAALLLVKVFKTPYDTFEKMGLKGPKPLPLLGNLLTFLSKSLAEVDVEHSRLYGKVYGTFAGSTPNLVIGNPELAQEVLVKEFSCFVNRTPVKAMQQKPLNRILTLLADDHWRHVRGKLSPTYSSGKLKQMTSLINSCVNSLLGYMGKQQSDVTTAKQVFSGYTMDVIAATAFGLEMRSLEEPDNAFLKSAKEFSSFGSTISPRRMAAIMATSLSDKLGIVAQKMGLHIVDPESLTYLERVVHKVMADGDGDQSKQNFLQQCREVLVDISKVSKASVKKASDGSLWTTEGLVEDEIISNSIAFLLGGHDTVATFLSFFCYAMATNPEVQQKLYDELSQHIEKDEITYEKLKELNYLDMCVRETLRMYPPALRLDRVCNKATRIGGFSIPEGISITIPVYAMHYDPDYWDEPHAFRPERFTAEAVALRHPCAYLPFGVGPRSCIGMRFALLEAKAAIAAAILKYQISPCKETPATPIKLGVSIAVLTPEKPIILSFQRR